MSPGQDSGGGERHIPDKRRGQSELGSASGQGGRKCDLGKNHSFQRPCICESHKRWQHGTWREVKRATGHLEDRIGCLYCVAVERTDCAHLLHCPTPLIRSIIMEKTFKKTQTVRRTWARGCCLHLQFLNTGGNP